MSFGIRAQPPPDSCDIVVEPEIFEQKLDEADEDVFREFINEQGGELLDPLGGIHENNNRPEQPFESFLQNIANIFPPVRILEVGLPQAIEQTFQYLNENNRNITDEHRTLIVEHFYRRMNEYIEQQLDAIGLCVDFETVLEPSITSFLAMNPNLFQLEAAQATYSIFRHLRRYRRDLSEPYLPLIRQDFEQRVANRRIRGDFERFSSDITDIITKTPDLFQMTVEQATDHIIRDLTIRNHLVGPQHRLLIQQDFEQRVTDMRIQAEFQNFKQPLDRILAETNSISFQLAAQPLTDYIIQRLTMLNYAVRKEHRPRILQYIVATTGCRL